jgi:hypothetical protein
MLLRRQVAFNDCGPRLMGREHLRQIGPTPPAAGPGPKTLAHLGGAAGALQPQKVQQLPLGNVKAEANFVVEFHYALFYKLAFSRANPSSSETSTL